MNAIVDLVALWTGRLLLFTLATLIIMVAWYWIITKVWATHSNYWLTRHYCLKVDPKNFWAFVRLEAERRGKKQ